MTVRDLLNVLFKRQRELAVIFGLFVLILVLGGLLPTASYTSTCTLFLQSKKEEVTQIDKDNPAVSRESRSILVSDVLTEAELLKSGELPHEVIDRLELAGTPIRGGDPEAGASREAWARYLARNLKVAPVTNSNIIKVSFVDGQRRRAADIVNSFADAYLSFRRSLANQSGVLEMFESEVRENLTALDTAEEALLGFDQGSSLSDPDTQKAQLLSRLESVRGEKSGLEVEQEKVQSEIASYRSRLRNYSPDVRKIEGVREDPSIGFIESALAELELEYSTLLTNHAERHPDVLSAQDRIVRLEEQLQEKTEQILRGRILSGEAELQALRSQIKKYEELEKALESRLIGIRSAESERERKRAEVEIRRDFHTMLSKRLNQTSFESNAGTTGSIDVVITSRGEVPDKRSFPPPIRLLLVLGIPAAFLAAITAALVLEFLDHRLGTPEQIEHHVGVPVLATIGKGRPASLGPFFKGPLD